MRRIIGVIGPLASGKDSVAEYIGKKLNVEVYQISSELKYIAKEESIPLNRENLINLSRKLVPLHGDEYLAKRIFEKYPGNIVVVGMRQIGQIDFLKNNSKFTLIGIDARPEIRFERVKSRNKSGDPKTLEEFIDIEKKDDGESVQKISDCMRKANYLVINEGTEQELYSKIDKIIEKENLI